MKIKVCLPIEVPIGPYCWKYDDSAICEHFDNEGGYEKCDLRFSYQKRAEEGVLKAPKCAALTSVAL